MAGKLTNTMAGSLSLLLLLLLSLSAIRCEKEEPPVWEDFIFVIPLRMTPPDSIVRKGDTLWLFADIPDTLFELNSGAHYQIKKPSLVSSIIARKLIGDEFYYSQQPGAITSFDFINKTGSVSNLSTTFGTLTLTWQKNHYQVLVGILPKAVGVYAISILNPEEFDLSSITLGFTSDGRKRVPIYRHVFYPINNGDTNFELFRRHCRAVSLDFPTEINIFYERKGTFTFRVVD